MTYHIIAPVAGQITPQPGQTLDRRPVEQRSLCVDRLRALSAERIVLFQRKPVGIDQHMTFRAGCVRAVPLNQLPRRQAAGYHFGQLRHVGWGARQTLAK